ncbi:MAG: divalent-cation tolerance protein CutA [Alphaproteobacteria bacterium]|nr:MAG: divalent-cation tolerance protein CutA [Alphaproteobacteria bacterium]
MGYSLIYVTAADAEEARALGRALVEARLAACANVLPQITPIYWWDGAVQEGSEAVLIAKTRDDLVPAVIDFVTARHSYECPCVIALPIRAGNPAFLDWIAAETAPPRQADTD